MLNIVVGSSQELLPEISADFHIVSIDGVLIRGSKPHPSAKKTLSFLRSRNIPFILLTNGGGYPEEKRADKLSRELDIPIDASLVVQGHTPFADMDQYKDKTVLVVGGEYDNCRDAALQYGFKQAVTPSDIFAQHPEIWPFSRVFKHHHSHEANPRPLPKPIDPSNPSQSLKIDAIFVYNDPRDWGLDTTIMVDCLLSREGIIGTLSPKNGNPELPNRGYQQDGQPPLHFSNADLWFASKFALPRLGQGGFRAAFEGVWRTVTGGAELERSIIGKPFKETYEFAERRLISLQGNSAQHSKKDTLENVYMIGDNPESDIRGANSYSSPFGSKWHSVLVRSGVFTGGEPSATPTVIVDDVLAGVQWGLRQSGVEATIE